MIQLGWKAGAEQYAPQELLEYAVAAERAGFDALSVSDHFHPWGRERPSLLRLDMAWCRRSPNHFNQARYRRHVSEPTDHPTIVAQAIATLSCFAPGRVLGVGRARH